MMKSLSIALIALSTIVGPPSSGQPQGDAQPYPFGICVGGGDGIKPVKLSDFGFHRLNFLVYDGNIKHLFAFFICPCVLRRWGGL